MDTRYHQPLVMPGIGNVDEVRVLGEGETDQFLLDEVSLLGRQASFGETSPVRQSSDEEDDGGRGPKVTVDLAVMPLVLGGEDLFCEWSLRLSDVPRLEPASGLVGEEVAAATLSEVGSLGFFDSLPKGAKAFGG